MSVADVAVGPHAPWRIELGQLDQKLGLEVLEQGVERVVVRIPVEGNRQSLGLLHGGAMLAIAEAAGSWAALIHASTHQMACVGVDVSATHLRSGRSGWVTATATPVKLGRSLDVHQVDITDDAGKLLSTFRITNMLVERHG